ncbi:CHASE3 domain-containing protein [Trinickia sp. Y13]|uniref:sensor histidine kinase n=1 Tax=Trinickia sp. Y13 TaxID=2917807 RepID=UPI00240581FC|nr:CHASE3 domain-containing protein [Trinickia sp. Y13]MDG0025809.1 CHASE3 domain-containing protein [Trinickia sp. Y13]
MDKAVKRFSSTASSWVGWGLPLIAVLMLITAGIGAFGTMSLYDSEAQVQHSNEIRSSLGQLLALARDAETGQRGFVITGRDEYLEPYSDAAPRIAREFDRLSSLLKGDGRQEQRLAKLRALMDRKHQELAKVIDMRRTQGFEAAQAIIMTDTGKAFMDQARATVAEMEDHVDEQLAARQANARRIRDLAVLSGLASGVLTLLVYASFGYVARRLLRDLAESARSLFDQKELLEVTLASIGDGVVATDIEGRVTFFNRVAQALSGWRGEEALGRPVGDILRLERTSDDSVAENPAITAMRERRSVDHSSGVVLVGRDGQRTHVDANGAPTFDPEGRLVGSVLVLHDVTERERAERQIRQRTEELARSNRDLEQFAYVASHDLQEPLRAVAGPLQLLQRRYQGQLDARADEFIGHAVDGATRMQTLIDDLLSYSRVGRLEDPKQPVPAEQALEFALKNLAVVIDETGAQIEHEALPVVQAISSQLALLFQNLIGNAIKFRSKERTPVIRVRAEPLGREWRFLVADNGIGISEQYFERIFVIFQRLHTRREYPGTGLGLALCKRIVEHHGGKIWVESTPGEGTTFYFTVPRAAAG